MYFSPGYHVEVVAVISLVYHMHIWRHLFNTDTSTVIYDHLLRLIINSMKHFILSYVFRSAH